MQENSNVKDRIIKICHEALHWDKSIRPSGTWCRHSFATNLHNAGVDMNYISESMGIHLPTMQSPKYTLNITLWKFRWRITQSC